MVPSEPIAGDENTVSPVVKNHFKAGCSGPLNGLLPVCCKSWWNIGHGVSARGFTAPIPGTNKAQGLVYVFVLRKGVWIQQAKLVTAVLRRKDEISGGLAIDGDTIVAGVADEDIGKDVNQGAAYVFTREGNSWVKKVKLKASGGRAIDLFGSSVGISGDTIIIGAHAADPFPEDGIRGAHDAAPILLFRTFRS